jgi:hypothetical protein
MLTASNDEILIVNYVTLCKRSPDPISLAEKSLPLLFEHFALSIIFGRNQSIRGLLN